MSIHTRHTGGFRLRLTVRRDVEPVTGNRPRGPAFALSRYQTGTGHNRELCYPLTNGLMNRRSAGLG